jgi:glycosyltransferase involved in cell wall biosynthesis
VRVLLDYRPALRRRSGVGEYTHQLVKALLAAFPADAPGDPLELTLFSSSWKDRLVLPEGELAGAAAIDRHVPVSVLNRAWHRFGWPPAELLTGRRFDVTHSLHPLILPSRAAAHLVTIHDLDFLAHPERTRAEIRRDYPRLARDHAHRADRVVVPSRFTAGEVERRLGVPGDRISVCPPGAPDWAPREASPPDGGYVLFFGTLEPRKNVGGLLDAYEQLIARRTAPPLVLAGQAAEGSRTWLERIARPPLAGVVRHIGYVDPSKRRELYAGARLLVQPSFDEGFGMPVLEAMTLGVPVVAADRGALPELLGDAGPLVDPEDPGQLSAAIARMVDDDAYAAACAAKGPLRARHFRWDLTARHVYGAYQMAIDRQVETRGDRRGERARPA